MTPESSAVLKKLLIDNDLGRTIELFGPNREQVINNLLNQLANLTAEFKRRYKDGSSFSPEDLLEQSERNPHKIRAFLQALISSGSLDMLVMVWRILQGQKIREVAMTYQEEKQFDLKVTLARRGQEAETMEIFHTNDISDAALLSHFGITTLNHLPVFLGFYSLKRN